MWRACSEFDAPMRALEELREDRAITGSMVHVALATTSMWVMCITGSRLALVMRGQIRAGNMAGNELKIGTYCPCLGG